MVVALGVALACSTPTLPLPPPAALTYDGPDAEGYVTISGEAEPGAYVMCFNRDNDEGVIVRADASGRFLARIRAMPGHTIEIWQSTGTERGPFTEIMIGDPRDAGPPPDAM